MRHRAERWRADRPMNGPRRWERLAGQTDRKGRQTGRQTDWFDRLAAGNGVLCTRCCVLSAELSVHSSARLQTCFFIWPDRCDKINLDEVKRGRSSSSSVGGGGGGGRPIVWPCVCEWDRSRVQNGRPWPSPFISHPGSWLINSRAGIKEGLSAVYSADNRISRL